MIWVIGVIGVVLAFFAGLAWRLFIESLPWIVGLIALAWVLLG